MAMTVLDAMVGPQLVRTPLAAPGASGVLRAFERLESWKEIAAFFRRGTRTVQRWEREEGLPIHRLAHEKLGSIYAYSSELETWRARRGGESRMETVPDPAPTVAVLPLADRTTERCENDLCHGLADEIAHALGKIAGVRVVSGRSGRPVREGESSREIGRRLGVSALLDGSVRRRGNELRAAVQLTGTGDGFQIWTGRYDIPAGGSFAAEEEIARSVASGLRRHLERLGEALRVRSQEADPQA
jgi:TolB-like protein